MPGGCGCGCSVAAAQRRLALPVSLSPTGRDRDRRSILSARWGCCANLRKRPPVSFDTQQLHPSMVMRNDRLEADCEQRGWTVGATRVTADYAAQKKLYDRYVAGTGNLAANPDTAGVVSPWGWQVHGSFHQVQADGFSHAIDYEIHGCTWEQFHEVAHVHGIGFPLFALGLGEPWHAQWWDLRGIYIDFAAPAEHTEDDVSLTIHYPTTRPNEPGVWDFQYLPASGSKVGAATVSTTVTVRQTPNTGVPVLVTVFFDGDPHTVTVPGDGRTATIDVTTAGLCSIVAAGVHVEAREFWS